MIIANPIYDVVFKKLMENNKVAKFFIGTLLDQTIESVEIQPQEFTIPKETIGFSVFRLDFIATIKADTGEYKKVLIEIQKGNNPDDLMRFRNYLAEQYKKTDIVNNKKVVLPITTVYILGFILPEIETPCVKVGRNYEDLVNNKTLKKKSDYIEKLSHDCYVVQVKRINGNYQTRLDKLLSIFEQSNFIEDSKISKNFYHDTEIDEIKIITDILEYVATKPEERKQIEMEQEAWDNLNEMLANAEERNLKELEEKKKELEESKKIIEEKKKEIDKAKKEIYKAKKELEKNKKETDKNKNEMEKKDREIEELKRRLNEQ